jgi:hypothetical protein
MIKHYEHIKALSKMTLRMTKKQEQPLSKTIVGVGKGILATMLEDLIMMNNFSYSKLKEI